MHANVTILNSFIFLLLPVILLPIPLVLLLPVCYSELVMSMHYKPLLLQFSGSVYNPYHSCMLTRKMHTYLSNEVFERPPGNSVISTFMGLGQVGVEDIHTHTEVRLIEVIGHIPANLQGQERCSVCYNILTKIVVDA